MNIALILSGGTGSRLGADIPKQYLEVKKRPVITWSMERLFLHEQIDAVQIVADVSWHSRIEGWIASYDKKVKFRGFSLPGDNRQLSILNGLTDISRYAVETDYVLIHDAARPCLSEKQVADCLSAAEGNDGVVPVLPMKDTVYLSVDKKKITSLLTRSEVFAGQAPEVFVLGKYLKANRDLLPDRILSIQGSTEPAVLAGMDMVMTAGDEQNFKITTKADLERFRNMTELA